MMKNSLLNKVFICCFTLFFCLLSLGAAQKTIRRDTLQRESIKLSPETINHYRSDSHFKYQEVQEAPSLFDRFMKWLFQFKLMQGFLKVSPTLTQIIIGLLFILLLIVLFRGRIHGVFLEGRMDHGKLVSESEISDQIPLEAMLREAENNKNFNLAVRYLYLMVLRNLNHQGKISYQPGKTNSQYQLELGSSEPAALFRKLTREYEYAWYGHFMVHATAYQQIMSEFKSLTGMQYD